MSKINVDVDNKIVHIDQEDQGLEQKISSKEKELANARAELKSTNSPEAVLAQQEKILKIQHEWEELKDQLKDLN